jgi:hypothetical protein
MIGYSDEGWGQTFGRKKPDLTNLKTGQWVMFCGHCGYTHKPDCMIKPECPECRSRMQQIHAPAKPDMLRVSIENGKYTVIQDGAGRLKALRHGEEWRDCVGDNLIFHLAHYVDDLRKLAEDAVTAEESQYVDWAKLNKESPDHDPNYKIEYPESVKKLRERLEALKK